MVIDDFPLGSVPLDSQQTVRKSYDQRKFGHRIVPVNESYNHVEYTYNDDGSINTVEFWYDDIAEITRISFVDDVSGSLDGTSFTMSAEDDIVKYAIFYSVNAGATLPPDSTTIHYILVNLLSNDSASIISKGTELALLADGYYNEYFTLTVDKYDIIITNTKKGNATDVVDNGTGFNFDIEQQGHRTLVDTYTYVYNDEGQVIDIVSDSGENLFNVPDIKNNLSAKRDDVAISDGTTPVGVTGLNELQVAASEKTPAHTEMMCALNEILGELKKHTIILQEMSDLELD